MSNLYAGTILTVDLTKRETFKEPTSAYAKDFLGGRGINIKLLYDRILPGVDPMDSGNILIFGVGPLGGTGISTGRTEVTAKSPVTGYLGSSNFGGFFASELKFAGYDHVVITGKAKSPVYIWIHDDDVEIRDAAPLWGKDTYQAPDIIREEVGNPEAKVACIGPAGENLVSFATIQHELGHGAGRTGMGAVMGSKNLKAVAVRGTKGLRLADSTKFLAIAAELKHATENNEDCQLIGQEGITRYQDDFIREQPGSGVSLTGGVPGEPGVNVPSMYAIFAKHETRRAGCYGCPIQCMDHYQIEGPGKGVISCQLYSELSTVLRCFDIDTSLECAILCQRYGVDCISIGGILRWLMELYEEGIITDKDTDGTAMEWGSPEAIRTILDKITFRQSVGDILAEGILPAAKKIGRGSETYASQIKGMTLIEGQDVSWLPYFKGSSLAGAVGPRGDHMRSLTPVAHERYIMPEVAKAITGTEKAALPQAYEGKPELVVYMEDIASISDLLSNCKWLSNYMLGILTPEYQAALFSAGSGLEISAEDLFHYAKKVRNLERSYEVGEGISREKDTLPKRFIDNPIPEGPWKGEVLESGKLEEMKSAYYKLRGWDIESGVPTEETLKMYSLDDVAENKKSRATF
jgi:aldehyde:ferredoxin oxidoreductase